MAFRSITLVHVDGNSGVTGELVVETVQAWQIAVGGTVGVYAKSDYVEKAASDSFADLFSGLAGRSVDLGVFDRFFGGR